MAGDTALARAAGHDSNRTKTLRLAEGPEVAGQIRHGVGQLRLDHQSRRSGSWREPGAAAILGAVRTTSRSRSATLAETLCPRIGCGGSATAENAGAYPTLRRKHSVLTLSGLRAVQNI